ncbi:MAG: hypothetical protein KGH63_03520, partial [Candidatus Micrarchaeota archaeon]|nr:hypothetical protein [Candidatus Micrarchaeota archaeon]
ADQAPLFLGLSAILLIALVCLVIFVAILAPRILRALNGPRAPPAAGEKKFEHEPILQSAARPPERKPAAHGAKHEPAHPARKLSGPGHQPHLKHKGKGR